MITLLSKIPNGLRKWRRLCGDGYAHGQFRSLGLGCAIGAVVGAGLHLLTRDSVFATSLHGRWLGLWSRGGFDGLGAYVPEMVALFIGIAIVAAPAAWAWLRRFARSWWAGITSLVWVVAACVTLVALGYASAWPLLSVVLGLVLIAALFAAELRRRDTIPIPETSGNLKLNIPVKKRPDFVDPRWEARSNDDPISDFEDDIIGRAAIVEVLALHALVLHTPVVALRGGLGDGKSSVLNLLRTAIERRAIVVSFSA